MMMIYCQQFQQKKKTFATVLSTVSPGGKAPELVREEQKEQYTSHQQQQQQGTVV